MKRYLITGGAGFIGSNFLKMMIHRHPEDVFVCYDALTYAGDISNLSECFKNANFNFIKGDIRDRDKVFTLFSENKFDIVVNFAAETHVDTSLVNPSLFFDTNVIGLVNLLDASVKNKVSLFHQVSTDEVYGDVPIDYEGEYFDEEHVLLPSSPYSSSKAAGDLISLSYFRTYGLNITISRCSNNFGPNQNEEKLIPHIIKKALNDERIPIYGDGRNIRDWLYVLDHCLAIETILEKGKAGDIYNISASNEWSNIDLVRYILKRLDKDESIIEFVKDRPGHDRRYVLSSEKIKKELGFKPISDFKSELDKTIDWYKDEFSSFSAVRDE